MSEQTYHLTRQDLRKPESRVSHMNNGKTPRDSNVSALKSVIDRNTDKAKEIEENKANLPLPDQPPVASDWQSLDQRTVNVGADDLKGPLAGETNSVLREPATAGSSVRVSGEELHKYTEPKEDTGRQGKDHLSDLPRDALY